MALNAVNEVDNPANGPNDVTMDENLVDDLAEAVHAVDPEAAGVRAQEKVRHRHQHARRILDGDVADGRDCRCGRPGR